MFAYYKNGSKYISVTVPIERVACFILKAVMQLWVGSRLPPHKSDPPNQIALSWVAHFLIFKHCSFNLLITIQFVFELQWWS